MPNVNIQSDDDYKLNTKPYKRKTPSRVSKKSVLENERKIAKSEIIENDFVEYQAFELERTSTPNKFNLCEHCNHSHAKECCMYIYDDYSDIMKYSSFKHNVEEPYIIVDNDENFNMKIGRTTPKNFPTFTENESSIADRKKISNMKQQPILYIPHYFWPVYIPPYPHFVKDPYFYNPNNFVYIPQMNIHNLMPPTYFSTAGIKQIPIPTHNLDRHYYNQQLAATTHHVPMNYNYF